MFESSFSANTVTKHYLKKNVTARFIRFWPKQWHRKRYMRVEVYGCKGKCYENIILFEKEAVTLNFRSSVLVFVFLFFSRRTGEKRKFDRLKNRLFLNSFVSGNQNNAMASIRFLFFEKLALLFI